MTDSVSDPAPADPAPVDTAPTDPTPASLGLLALATAQGELARGVREAHPGQHDGPDVDRYLSGCIRNRHPLPLHGVNWCAAFASWCTWTAWSSGSAAGFAADTLAWPTARDGTAPPLPPIGYRAAVAELVADARTNGTWHDIQELGAPPSAPAPGDLLIFARDGGDPRHGGLGHVGFCASVDGATRWTLLGGNGPGGRVALEPRSTSDTIEKLVGWISMS
jgi:hypothetical protein